MHFVSPLTILAKWPHLPISTQPSIYIPHIFLQCLQFPSHVVSQTSTIQFLFPLTEQLFSFPFTSQLSCPSSPNVSPAFLHSFAFPPFLALDSHPPPAASLSLPRWSPPQLSVGPLLAPSTARAGPSSQSSPSSLMPAGGGAYKFRCVTAFLASMWHPVTPFVAACDALWRDPPAFSGHRWLLVDPSSSSSAVGGLQSRSWRSKEPPVMRFTEGGGRGVEG